MGKKWTWLAKIFAFFGAGVGLFGIGTFTQVNSIASAVKNFFDPDMAHTVSLLGGKLFMGYCDRRIIPDSVCRSCCSWRNPENCKSI